MGPHGVTVNAVAPGAIEMVGPSRKPPLGDEYLKAALQEIPIGRKGQPEEVADAVLFFASPRARYITGQLLCVDGGFSAGKLGVRGNSPTWLGPKRGIG
jgi:3-oxoacyl-[acyl-carrier protein] reductase